MSRIPLLRLARQVCAPADFDALVLHLQGYNRDDIALVLGCSVRTVNDRIARAKLTIERHLADQEA